MTDRPSTPLDKLIRPPAMMPDPPEDPPPPATLEEIEQRVQAELDTALVTVETAIAYEPADVAALGTLAATLRNVHPARATPLGAAAPPPPFDVDTLCARVWNAVQDAGAPTAASDAAVDAIREIVGGEA
jgi:hypothetical protein